MANVIRFFDHPNGKPFIWKVQPGSTVPALSVGDGVQLPVGQPSVVLVVKSIVHRFVPNGDVASDYLCEIARRGVSTRESKAESLFENLDGGDGAGSTVEPPLWVVR